MFHKEVDIADTPPPPIFGHLQLHYAAMETKATDNGGALENHSPRLPPFPKSQWSECCSTLLYSFLLNW